MAARARRVAAAFGIAIVTLFAPAAVAAQTAAQPLPEWPSPPAAARIRFVRALDPMSARRKPGLLSRLAKLIVGGGDEPRMLQPYGIAVAADGKIYVADTLARIVHVYDVARPAYSSIAVEGESLIGIAASSGRLFVTDSTAGRLLCLDAKGRRLWTLDKADGLLRPTGIAVSDDRLYVVDTILNRVVVVTLAGQIVRTFGERGSGPGQFNFPTNIARAADGRLFVTDTMNFRVQVFDSDGRYLSSFGQLGDGAGDFDKPKGIAVDSGGHIYVVEGFNDVVQIFDESGRLLLAFGESGSAAGQFWLPTGIAIANDMVYVSDSANRRLQVFEYLKERP